ncbi:MAG TPA: amidohydrolase [Acidobacteria bacterium]|nr:amidohydrolase [Acidobacteriota bacterium]
MMSVIKLSGLRIFWLKTPSAPAPENRRFGAARAKLVTLFLSFLLLCNLTIKLVGDDGPKAQSEPEQMAITGARILTASGQNYEKGTILIRAGKIVEVGENIKIPEGTRIIEARGCLVTPGLIDAHSHLGLGPSGGVTEDNEMSDPVTPQLRIIDSIHPEGLGPDKNQFLNAVAEGVTAAVVRPGSGNVIGGQSAVLKLRGRTVDEMCLKFPADMKMALGRKGAYAQKGQMPMTKMGTAFLVRQAMLEAAEYKKALENYEKEKRKNPGASPPPRDLKKEAMLLVLDRKIPVHIHVGTADDIMTAVRLANEFGFKQLSLAHAEEAYKVAEELASNKVVVVVGPRMITYDDQNRLINLADYLYRRGVEVCIMTDADVVQQPFLRTQAALAVKYGMEAEAALRAITINPARLAGLEDRLGSLEKGKDADLVVWSGDLFDVRQEALRVFIDGREVYRNPKLGGN